MIILIGCSKGPFRLEVKEDFLKEKSDVKIQSLFPEEGDSSAVYYRIKYINVNGEEKEEVWQYLKIDGSWKLNHKEVLE